MKRFSEQLHKKAQTVKLRAVERRELKERLVAYMEYHPLPKTRAQKNAEAYIQSESFTAIRINPLQFKAAFGFLATILLILVPVVAERSLPGDVLYPVKVNFNEEIRSTLVTSPYAEVEWETKLLERRIAEARLLASEGKLTEEVESEVASAVKAHSDAAQAGIAKLRESDSEEAAIAEITFESALTVQSEVLEGTIAKEVALSGGSDAAPGRSVALLAGAVDEARKDATAKQSGVIPSYARLAARMEQETTRAYELFETIKSSASESEVSDVKRRLSDVERKIAEAAELYSGGEGVDTVTADGEVRAEVALLRTALSDIQKLISFMTDIDVRENVSVEELVPVTLTEEEETAQLEAMYREIDTLIPEVSLMLENREADELTPKLEAGLTEAIKNASSSKVALESGDFAGAAVSATAALELLTDIAAEGENVRVPEVDSGPNDETDTGTSTEEANSGEEATTSPANNATSTTTTVGASSSVDVSPAGIRNRVEEILDGEV